MEESLEIIPTDEQARICSMADNATHLQIKAFAGTGKTETLKMMARLIEGPKLYCAFNKRVVEEAGEKFEEVGAECRTWNSIGHRGWMKCCATRVVLNGKKTAELFKEALKGFSKNDQNDLWDSYQEIIETVGLAKARGYIPERVNKSSRRLVGEEFWSGVPASSLVQRKVVDTILDNSIRLAYAGSIDFDDQLYMPTLFGGSFPRFPTVLADEEQDLNPIIHKMVDKLIKGGRLISVGDPFQSIYQFRGALQDGMAINKERRFMDEATLSVSFRCKSRIVENARWRVPDFKWHQPGGRVESLRELGSKDIKDGAAIICRNNAPLFRLALLLLSNERACRVAGSDIGPRLINTLKRLGDAGMGRSSVLSAIDDWEERKDPNKASTRDMADCMRLFAQESKTLAEAIARAEFVLRQDGPLYLLTGHKSKGLEWETVYHLDPWLIKNDEEQELNLRYVIQTRAKEEFYEIDSVGIG